MNLQQHFVLMAHYNQRMNRQVYGFVKTLDNAEITQARGAFFQSILGTLNHILVGDLIWLTRFATHSTRYQSLRTLSASPLPRSLDHMLYHDIDALYARREQLDTLLCHWLNEEVTEADFHNRLAYRDTKGIASQRDFGELVSHLFNHQTHHRGQLSTLLNQMQIDIGETDFLLEIPDHQ